MTETLTIAPTENSGTIQLGEAASFAYDPAHRRLSGILLPFGELSRLNVTGQQPVMFEADSITLPRDPGAVTLNERHSQHHPIARATLLEKRPGVGVYAEFEVFDTDEGDAYLAARSQPGAMRKLSAEVFGLLRDGARAVAARLTGAAVVPEGAFAGAVLFEIAPDVAPTDPTAADAAPASPSPTAQLDAAASAAVVPSTPAAPAAVVTDRPVTTEGETPMTGSIVPDGNVAPDVAPVASPNLGAAALFAALTAAKNGGDTSQLEQFRALGDLFAISALQHSGPTTLTIGADVQAPQALGELWSGRTYQRKYVPLFGHANLTGMNVTGWKWDPTKSPEVSDYAGNTAEVPSNVVDTLPVSEAADRLAGGHRLDRRFIDFPDQSLYASYFRKMTESYARKSDAKCLGYALAAATVVAPGAVPAGVAKGLAAVVDGAMGVIASENTPTFSIVSPELWRDIVLTGYTAVLGYLSASVGLEDGTLDGFKLIPGNVGTGKVLTGSGDAMTVYELPGVPVRVEGIAPHHGAIDPALYGYIGKTINTPAATAVTTTTTALSLVTVV